MSKVHEAAVEAFTEVTAYWAPEWIHSPQHVAKMIDTVITAVRIADAEKMDAALETTNSTPVNGLPRVMSLTLNEREVAVIGGLSTLGFLVVTALSNGEGLPAEFPSCCHAHSEVYENADAQTRALGKTDFDALFTRIVMLSKAAFPNLAVRQL